MSGVEGKVVETYEEFFAADPPVMWFTTVDGVQCLNARHPGVCVDGSPGSMLLGPEPPASGHVVEINEDNTITVRPNPPMDPGNSNSILCPLCGWHGYIYSNIWTAVG